MENKKEMQELEELKKQPQKIRAMIALLEELLEEQPENSNLERTITKHIIRLGVPAHIKGFKYLRKAVEMTVKKPEIIEAVTKELYPEVAKVFYTTSSRTERAIRHAIEVAWDRGEIEVLQEYFGTTMSYVKGKPTNSEFIAMLADKIRLDMI